MRLYRIIYAGRSFWFGTQADANASKKEHGVGWTETEVPTDKAGLLAFLNDLTIGGVASVETDHLSEEEFVNKFVDRAGSSPTADLPEAIRLTTGTAFGLVLEATLQRAGELDRAGWQAFQRLFGTPGVAIERGLRFLALAQLHQINGVERGA